MLFSRKQGVGSAMRRNSSVLPYLSDVKSAVLVNRLPEISRNHFKGYKDSGMKINVIGSYESQELEETNADKSVNDSSKSNQRSPRVTFKIESDSEDEKEELERTPGESFRYGVKDNQKRNYMRSDFMEPTRFPPLDHKVSPDTVPPLRSSVKDTALTGRQRKVGRAGDQINVTKLRKLSIVSTGQDYRIDRLKQSQRRRYSTSVVPTAIQHVGIRESKHQETPGISLRDNQHDKRNNNNDCFLERGRKCTDRRNSISSGQAVYGNSKNSVSNMSEINAFNGINYTCYNEDGYDESVLLPDRKSSLISKIRAWRTTGPERPTQDMTQTRVRHSASLPALMSYQHKPNQRIPHQQQHFQTSQLQQRRLRRKSSLAPSYNSGTPTSWRQNRRNADNYPMTGAGLRRFLRKTLSQGDFTKTCALKKFMPLVKFRRAVKMILLLQRATYNSRERTQRRERNFSLWASVLSGSFATSKRAYEMYGISFDPQDFKANREIQVSAEAKAILSLEPCRRTPHQLRLVLMSLRQSVKEFSEFPITMQESLARVGWYEHFEAKRVIIRQGHTAENFYFILSGTAVVIVLETDKHTGEQAARTAAFLGKGKSFGELALMHKSKRSATVTCKDDVELLAVGREDFIDIFMHVERDVEPEHVRFLRSLNILRDWPIEVLPFDNPQILLFTYVRRGVLLCKNSNNSEWIYVVKSGSCSVIKALRSAHSSDSRRPLSKSLNTLKDVGDLYSAAHTFPPKPSLPSIGSGRSKLTINEKKKSARRKGSASLALVRDDSELERTELEHMQTLDAIMEQRHSTPAHGETGTQAEEDALQNVHHKHRDSRSATANTVFVQVLKLVPRDIYGLEACVFKSMNKTTSTSLVSGGAELIMINRKFFFDHTSEQLRKQIRREIRPLPSEETLQTQLENKMSWETYRHLTLKKAIDARKKHTTLVELHST